MAFDYQSHIDEIANISDLGLVILDDNRQLVWCNQRFASWAGKDAVTLEGKSWLSLPLEPLDANGLTYNLISLTGLEQTLLHWQSPLPSKPELDCHFFKSLPNSKSFSNIDKLPLSLPKRPNWSEYLDYEVSRSRRYQNPLCLAKVKLVIFNADEIDGESVQVDLHDVLKDELRWADMISAANDDEPLLVLPETTKEDAQGIQNKVASAFAQKHSELDYRIAWGIAEWKKGDTSGSLLQRSRDELLKELKQLQQSLS